MTPLAYILTAAIIVVTFIGYALIQILAAWLSAWYTVKRAPREPMFLCKVHGPIREKNIVTFSDYEGIYTDVNGQVKDGKGDFKYCTLCLNERLNNAEKAPTL